MLLFPILQKPSPRSKAKEHSEFILRRLEMKRKGLLNLLLQEIKSIQQKFVKLDHSRTPQ